MEQNRSTPEIIEAEATEVTDAEVTTVDAESTIPPGMMNITPGQLMAMLNRAANRAKVREKNRARNKVARAQRRVNRRNNKGNH